jgi:hypothetical protein
LGDISVAVRTSAKVCIHLAEHVWFPVSDMLLPAFQGLDNRKNKFPAGNVMVTLFVPFAALI